MISYTSSKVIFALKFFTESTHANITLLPYDLFQDKFHNKTHSYPKNHEIKTRGARDFRQQSKEGRILG